jgi:hypothetical protein
MTEQEKDPMKSLTLALALALNTPALAGQITCGGTQWANDGTGIVSRPILCAPGNWCWVARSPEEAALCAAPAPPPPSPAEVQAQKQREKDWRDYEEEQRRLAEAQKRHVVQPGDMHAPGTKPGDEGYGE